MREVYTPKRKNQHLKLSERIKIEVGLAFFYQSLATFFTSLKSHIFLNALRKNIRLR